MGIVRAPSSVVVAGHICLDVIPDLGPLPRSSFAESFRPGRLIEAGAASLATGGVVGNTGLALHVLGVPTRLVGKIGDDQFGRIVRELIDAYSGELSAGLKIEAGGSTSFSVIVSPPGADRFFLHHPGVNRSFGAEDIDFGLLEQAALFHFGYPPLMRRMYSEGGRELARMFERARAKRATTSLDMSYPDPATESGKADWHEILETALPFVDVFAPSLDELLFMLQRPLSDELSRRGPVASLARPALVHELGEELIRLGVGVAAIKLGDRGLYLRTAGAERISGLGRARPTDPGTWTDRELWVPCFAVEVAGTTGSGDSTVAGLLAALTRGLDAEDAVTAAVAVGACNVERADALSGIRSWDETVERVRSSWPRLALELDDPGWRRDEEHELWIGPSDSSRSR
jgi:sugar/nucleoside kinase (ribokinase family)